jgi:hypothetical protein
MIEEAQQPRDGKNQQQIAATIKARSSPHRDALQSAIIWLENFS